MVSINRERNFISGAEGTALYVREAFCSFRQSKLECSCDEACAFRICSRMNKFLLMPITVTQGTMVHLMTVSCLKQAVQAAKRMADRRWGERLGNDFEGNKKIFWKEVKRVRKGEQTREEMVTDVNGQILSDGVEVKRRSAEYFSRT